MVIDIEGKKFIHGIIRDISERIEYQYTIIRERNTAQNYLDITGSIIVVLDSEGNVSLINQKGLALLEYQREDIIGKNWFDHYIPVNIRGIIKEIFSKLINEEIESPDFFENTVMTASGQKRSSSGTMP
jgi:PAS domain S-box-containing protein